MFGFAEYLNRLSNWLNNTKRTAFAGRVSELYDKIENKCKKNQSIPNY